MLWLIVAMHKPNNEADRDRLRSVHHDYLTSRKDVLVLSGPTHDPEGKRKTGSVFLINAGSFKEAKAFSQNEPYTQAGLYANVTITRMSKSQWNPQSAANA